MCTVFWPSDLHLIQTAVMRAQLRRSSFDARFPSFVEIRIFHLITSFYLVLLIVFRLRSVLLNNIPVIIPSSRKKIATSLGFYAHDCVVNMNLKSPCTVHRYCYSLYTVMLDRVTMTTVSSTNGATTLSRMNFYRYVGHVTIFSWMLTTACCSVGLGLGLDLVSGWLMLVNICTVYTAVLSVVIVTLPWCYWLCYTYVFNCPVNSIFHRFATHLTCDWSALQHWYLHVLHIHNPCVHS